MVLATDMKFLGKGTPKRRMKKRVKGLQNLLEPNLGLLHISGMRTFRSETQEQQNEESTEK